MITPEWKLHSALPDFLGELSAAEKNRSNFYGDKTKSTRNQVLTVNADTDQYRYQSGCMCVKLLEPGVLCLSLNMLQVEPLLVFYDQHLIW